LLTKACIFFLSLLSINNSKSHNFILQDLEVLLEALLFLEILDFDGKVS